MKLYLKSTSCLLAGIFFLITLFTFQVHAVNLTPNGLFAYTSQSTFESAFPDLAKEDFEESTIGDTSGAPFPKPLNSSTGNAYFSPGDILDGLNITTEGIANPGFELAIAGGNFPTWNNTSKAVSNANLLNLFTVEFSGSAVNAVGMDLVFLSTTGDCVIKIYTNGDMLIETVTQALAITPSFFGIYSTQPITKITLTKTPNDNKVMVDNIQFGTVSSLLTFYTDQNGFEAAHPGLPVEDFEESPVAPTTRVEFSAPLDKKTDIPGVFSPGDILDDIHIRPIITTTPATALQVVGVNYASSMGNSSKLVCQGAGGSDLDVGFYNETASGYELDTYAVGMDLMQYAPAGNLPQDAVVAVYDLSNKLLGSTTVSVLAGQENFIGVDSIEPMVKITIQFTGSSPPNECVDNIQVGVSPPASLTFYSTEADFKKARSGLSKEDFAESPVPENTLQVCNEPIDSTTNETGCFAPGDILPNITFQTENSLLAACPACLNFYGANTSLGNTTPILNVPPPDKLELAFSGKMVHYAGINMYSLALISIYDLNDTLLGSAVHYPLTIDLGFWGVKSAEPIGRITLWGGGYLSEVIFGGKFPWTMYRAAMNGGGGKSSGKTLSLPD